jgi:hypothetical protein
MAATDSGIFAFFKEKDLALLERLKKLSLYRIIELFYSFTKNLTAQNQSDSHPRANGVVSDRYGLPDAFF